jgi:hypothetical protein
MQLTPDLMCSAYIETVCLTLQSDLDLAFSYLRLAEAETRGGRVAHATELITKAVITCKIVERELVCIPGLNENKHELAREARRLLESIQSVERQLRIL